MAVEISTGIRIDDAFASRLVDLMLTDLNRSVQALRLSLGKGDYRSSLGNPKGQRRVYNRIIKNQHSGLLSARLDTGTRLRFMMAFDLWDATPASEDGSGPLSWLVGSRLEFHGRGTATGNDIKHVFMEMIALSRHALERLVQRGAVKTPEDFIRVLKRAWTVLSFALSCASHLPKDGSSWTVPVTLENGTNLFLPVVRNLDKGPWLIVPTVLTADMGIDALALEPLVDLFNEYADADNLDKLVEDPRLAEAFKATAKATRKGRRA